MRNIDMIVIHCSDSAFGNAALINKWHIDQGWRKIGYHYVILNAYPDPDHHKSKRLDRDSDGFIETGREIEAVGSHAKGHNKNSIGICLIGTDSFTGLQMNRLVSLCSYLIHTYDIKIDPVLRDGEIVSGIVGHNELNSDKTCPNLDPDWFRNELRRFVNV